MSEMRRRLVEIICDDVGFSIEGDRASDLVTKILLAMREPTKAMTEAGTALWINGDWDHWKGLARADVDREADTDDPAIPGLQTVWRNMIDVALAP